MKIHLNKNILQNLPAGTRRITSNIEEERNFEINLKGKVERTGLAFIQNAAFIYSINSPGLPPAKLKCYVFRTFFFFLCKH